MSRKQIMEPIHNDHNVYILGAGFSAAAGLPTMKDFLTRMRDAHPWLESRERNVEAEAVGNVLEFRRKAMSAGYWTSINLENLEELFSLASAEGAELTEHMRVAIAATLDYCGKGAAHLTLGMQPSGILPDEFMSLFPWIGQPIPNHGQVVFRVPPYCFYLANLLGIMNDDGSKPTGENTFITFNYDTVLEDNLALLKVPFSYGFASKNAAFIQDAKAAEDEKAIKVLKLHGSVNWFCHRIEGNPKLYTVGVLRDYEQLREANKPPELMPPTWRKDFAIGMEDVWLKAIRSLSTATRIIVIGFSMPPNDVHFRYLVSAGLKDNISLREIFFIDPDSNIKKRASALFREEHINAGRIQFVPHYIENYITAHSNPTNIGRGRYGKGTLFTMHQ